MKQDRIESVAELLGLSPAALRPYGREIAKVDPALAQASPRGRVILVSAMNPTRTGEGKTTTSIGLAQGLRRIGAHAALALREPSLGPVFGVKGGGTGGGRSTVEPKERINLHFTGDLHAIGAANNLLAAMIDNALMRGSLPELRPSRVVWRRAIDMNDRGLRRVVTGLGEGNGETAETGFDITAASEVMAVLSLARSVPDLKARLGRMVIGYADDGRPIVADEVGATGAMAALLGDALWPNLVQSAEGVPALVHGGPFANIAHGCNSVLATRIAMAHADYTITEAGFGMDLGGEKFLHIKCRAAGIWPSAVVLVATAKALKWHGGARRKDIEQPDAAALARGLDNLWHHCDTVRAFGLQPVVAINRFASDDGAELREIIEACTARGIPCEIADPFGSGGEGCEALAARVKEIADGAEGEAQQLFDFDSPLSERIASIARRVYGADGIALSPRARKVLDEAPNRGYGGLPICMARAPSTLSGVAKDRGRPQGFTLPIRDVRVSAGAGFMVAYAGEISTMPGLGAKPAALDIDLDAEGEITGLS